MIDPMEATILAVGSELLGPTRVDTNSLRLTEILERYGVRLRSKSVVGDDLAALSGELQRAASTSALVLVTGGLGPTSDDLTREAAAQGFGLELQRRPEVVEGIRVMFERMGRPMPEVNARQADILEGARVLENDRGTAPGQAVEVGSSTVFFLPGVPTEMLSMAAAYVEPWLESNTPGEVTSTAVFRIACLSESAVEEALEPLYALVGRERVTVLASPGDIKIHLHCSGVTDRRLEQAERARFLLKRLFGDDLYGEGAEGGLEVSVGQLLRQHGLTIATAESCTGGLVAERLTRIAGSSRYFLGSFVTYANAAKENLLGVPAEVLASDGAVSQAVVRHMASGLLGQIEADYAVSISGIAGPGGGSEDKPVGTVWIGWDSRDGSLFEQSVFCFPGDRERVRWLASQFALNRLRLELVARLRRSQKVRT